jgi:hypothetical protein
MIKVGILDNTRILKAEKNDKGTLVITYQESAGGGKTLADALNSTSENSQDSDNGIIIWPVKVNENLQTLKEKSDDVSNKLKSLRGFLSHVLLQYMTEDKIQWNALANVTVTSEEDLIRALAENEALVNKIYDNYVTQFISMITPHVGPSSPLFRTKFIRQSKEKHFPTLPRFAPFMEPMTVPKSASKLTFTPYEKGYRKTDDKEKPETWTGVDLSSDKPVATEGQSGGGNPAEAKAVDDLFGINK